MQTRKYLNILLSFVFITSLVFGSVVQVRAENSMAPAAMPMNPTDETKVPHYFGPYPNWANSQFTLPNVSVAIVGDGWSEWHSDRYQHYKPRQRLHSGNG
jgi:hypothetical protein